MKLSRYDWERVRIWLAGLLDHPVCGFCCAVAPLRKSERDRQGWCRLTLPCGEASDWCGRCSMH